MKYIKFTYVDSRTGISVASHPAENGPAFPAVDGLTFEWARESAYPTPVPEFFGTCTDSAFTMIDGVLDVLSQADYGNLRADELRARIPQKVTRRQGRQALLLAGKLDQVPLAIAAIVDETERRMAHLEWEDAQEYERQRPLVVMMGAALGLDLDALFIHADTL